MKKLAVLALLAASAIPAVAGDFYVVGSVGQSEFDTNKSDIDSGLASVGLPPTSSSLDKNDTGYKLQLGYQFNNNFAVEGGYVDLGKIKYSAAVAGTTANAEVKAKGWNIDVVGILPLNESFSLFGKVGAINANVKANVSAVGRGSMSGDSTDWKATWGVGAAYNINKQLAVRLEYEQFNDLGDDDNTPKGDVQLISAGIVFKF